MEVELILRIREKCEAFSGRVGGVRTLEKAQSESPQWDIMPQCFIMTIQKNKQTDPQGNSSFQRIECQFATIIAMSNKTDEKTDSSGISYNNAELIEKQLFNALLGWSPITSQSYQDFGNVKFDRAFFLSAENGIIWWEYDWSYSYYIDSDYQNESMDNVPQDIKDFLYPDKPDYQHPQAVVPNDSFPVNIKDLIMQKYNLNETQYNEIKSHVVFI